MTNTDDKDIQVDGSDLPIVTFDVEEYKNKKKKLESLLDQINKISGEIEKCIEENEEELQITETLKKSRLEKQIYKQRNIDLREENDCMKEYLKLREENDELELNIMEMEMKKKHRLSNLENKYLINLHQHQFYQQNNPPPQIMQPINNNPVPAPASVPTTAPVSTTAPPPPPPPPSVPLQNYEKKQNNTAIAPPATHNTVRPMNVNDEIKSLISNKFKNAYPD